MKALLFKGPKKIVIEEIPTPKISNDSLLIRVKAAFICATDLKIFRGERNVKQDIILGHEFSGEVIEVGTSVKNFTVGDHVSIYPIIADGTCDYCLKGFRNRCVHRKTIGIDLNGGFAEYFLAPKEMISLGHLIKIPENVSFEEAALLEPLSTVINSIEKIGVEYGDNVLIIGAGPMGLLHVMMAKLRGAANIIVSDLINERLTIAKELGATCVINPKETDFPYSISKHLNYEIDKIILTVCIPEIIEHLLSIIRPQGKITFFAGSGKTCFSNIDLNKIHYKELTLTATQSATLEQFKKGLKLISSKRLDVKKIITCSFPLLDAEKAFTLRNELKALKVLLKP